MSTTLTVSSKGQIAIPRKYREALRLSEGAKLKISLGLDGTLVIKPLKGNIVDIFGCLGRTDKRSL
jgi:AbrB family looped-hinge helix DNA binding protein